jgi:hypothetical protein
MNEESRPHLPLTEEANAAIAARSIERALHHFDPAPVEPASVEVTIAEMVEIVHVEFIAMRSQIAAVEARMAKGLADIEARFIAIEHRLDDGEARLTDLERRMYMPPDLVEALKNGGNG